MKLLYITNGVNGAGGLERILAVKASYLVDKLGYEVHILSLNEPQPHPFYTFSDKIHFHSCEVKGNPLQYIFSYVKGIKNTVSIIKPDVISVCDDGLKGFFVPLFLGKKVPIIYERHASVQLNFSSHSTGFTTKVLHFLMQQLGRTFDVFVVLTNGNLKEWNSKNLKVISNPLSFYSSVSSTLQNKKVIVVGSHSYNKGYDLLLQAWELIIQNRTDWTLHIFGKSDTNQTFHKLSESLSLTPYIVFSEPVADIQNEYLSSSIMVLPSRSEGFGMVLIEAMACGLPCVSFDCPHGPADIIRHEEDGLLVKAEDVNALAASIIRLVQNDDLRIKMGANARENVKRYLPENVLPQWDTLFKWLIAKK
jgi:glycosyltransferase involved in cell wall biosynthesis